MTRIIIALFLLLPVTCMSQNYLTKSKDRVKKELAIYAKKNDSLQAKITATDSSITLSIADKKVQPADFIYSFNSSGQCSIEKIITSCDSCLAKYLQTLLDKKEYGWKKINENQYVSKFAAAMMIELPVENTGHSFMILHMDWTRKLYDLISGN